MIGRTMVCDDIGHKWEDVYYGVKCMNCGLLVPDGCEYWMPYDDEEPDYTDWFDLDTIEG